MKKFTIALLVIGTTISFYSCKKIRTCECTETTSIEGETYTDPSTGEIYVYSKDTSYSETNIYPIETPMSKKNGETYCEAIGSSDTYDKTTVSNVCKLKE